MTFYKSWKNEFKLENDSFISVDLDRAILIKLFLLNLQILLGVIYVIWWKIYKTLVNLQFKDFNQITFNYFKFWKIYPELSIQSTFQTY